jgi:hypothetical protein
VTLTYSDVMYWFSFCHLAWIVEALVNCMVELYRNAPLDATDVLGRTPLHIAALSGSIDAIPILTNGSTMNSFITAPLLQDKWLRCPLHWACTHPIGYTSRENDYGVYSDMYENNTILCKLACQPRKNTTDMFDAVCTLLSSYPEATIIRDSDGKTPLELAIEHNADPNIIRIVSKMEQSVRQEHECFRCHNFWGDYTNEEATSVTITESDSFLQGIPGEISVHTSRSKSSHEYFAFEC